jgi:hypothetical protein
MSSFVFKLVVKGLLWLVTRHRVLHLRDWIASVVAIFIIGVIGAWPHAAATSAAVRVGGLGEIFSWGALWFVVVLLLAFVPLAYIIKLRRLGITDADYSVATGIDYSAALSTVTKGFRFAGVGASKLREREQDFREALERTTKHRGKIRMLLVSPESSKAIKGLEQHDNTCAYKEKIEGTQLFFQRFAIDHPEHIEMRYYSPNDVDSMRPFRLFFNDQDCLLSPFMFGTGVQDQGRGLPQLRITSSGFPSKKLPTLFTSFEKYFDFEWKMAEEFKGSGNDQR